MSERDIWQRTYDRKGFVAISAMTAVLAACGGDDDDGEPAARETTEGPVKATGTLLYYNWADYVNPKTYTDFTAKTGVKIKKDFYASNEDLQAKLQAGATGYDLVVPTGYMVNILREAGKLQEIDWSKLPNAEKNIDPKFRGLPYDPDNKYSVAKDWGTTGFMYRKDLLKAKPTSWRDFYDVAMGEASGKLTMVDSNPEVIGSTLVMLGYSYNTDDEKELEEAKQQLLKLKPHVLALHSSEYKNLLTSGRSILALGWNGDAAAVGLKKPMEYVIAEEGGEFWVDTYTIPVGAKNPNAAYAWIDFVYDPKINAQETEYTNYGSPVKRELLKPVIDPKVLANPDVFPTDKQMENLVPNEVSPKGTKIRNRIWTEFKAA
jgi:spermidine/putrescine transport system substrate-binding protein